MRLFTKKVLAVCGLALALSVTGCGKKDKGDDEEETDPNAPGGNGGGGSTDTVTVAGKLSVGTALALAPTIDQLKLFCVTFEETPRSGTSDFGADGAFSVGMPKNVNFGCFVNDKTTNLPVAQFVIVAEGGFGGGSTSLGLSGSVDLGDLVIGADGTVSIPASAFANVTSTAGTSIDVDQLHNHTFQMECQDNGNAESFAACQNDLADGGGQPMTVYLRILKGTQEDKDVIGMGVWQDGPTFTACGSVDMEAAMQEKIATEGITFSQVSVGTFTPGTGCEARSDQGGDEDNPARNLKGYYAISELVSNGSGYSFRDHGGGGSPTGGCSHDHSTAIEFTGSSDLMFGAFTNSEHIYGDCQGEESGDKLSSFNVKFTKID